ncbi:MAG TPA: PhzF family phenazine biosynthesis isomerase [Polyangiaceae bacterium]|nr:PhzF family phenazine biosynthesis isomerase [Polyangiaceae bacterium]
MGTSDEAASRIHAGDELHVVSVFTREGRGGNKTTISLDADALSAGEMQDIALRFGHESGFVSSPPEGREFDFTFRFFVPKHEMEMCGHATVGAMWILHRLGRLPQGRERVRIWTKSGLVEGRVVQDDQGSARMEITQPKGHVSPLPEPVANMARIASVLGIAAGDLAGPIQNAWTSRVKTLVPLKNAAAVNALTPDFARIENLCADIGSTGLYPYAPVDLERRLFEARQFPKSSGYPEDPATGIAAAALAFGLLENGIVQADHRSIYVHQGRAMGQWSEIRISFQMDGPRAIGCWLTGDVSECE